MLPFLFDVHLRNLVNLHGLRHRWHQLLQLTLFGGIDGQNPINSYMAASLNVLIRNAARVPPHTMMVLVLVLVFFGARGADSGSFLGDLGSLLGLSFGSWEKGCRQQPKTSKTAPLCSTRFSLPNRLPPSVLAIRSDFFCVSKMFKKHANHNVQRAEMEQTCLAKGAWRCRRVLFLSVFCSFFSLPALGRHRMLLPSVAERARPGGTYRRGSW